MTSPEYFPLRVAEAEGFFTREGLEVTIQTTRAEPGAAEALVQGQADLAATSLDAMLRFGPRSVNQGAAARLRADGGSAGGAAGAHVASAAS